MKKWKWKNILISILILPIVVFFPACSCNSEQPTLKEPNQYIVRFYTDSKDTFNIPSQTIEEGNLVREPDRPTKTGYAFIGWYKDMDRTQIWTFLVDTVHENMTLYARWEKRI